MNQTKSVKMRHENKKSIAQHQGLTVRVHMYFTNTKVHEDKALSATLILNPKFDLRINAKPKLTTEHLQSTFIFRCHLKMYFL